MIGFHRLHTVHSTQKMPKNKVLSLNQKAQICEASLAPGFDKDHCIKKFEISRSCLNRILNNKDQFMTFCDSKKHPTKFKNLRKGKNFQLESKLTEWIKIRSAKGYPIGGEDIKTRAKNMTLEIYAISRPR